jgi:hypothetical protein
LLKRGITGQIRKWRNGTLSAEGDIEQFAGLTIRETRKSGPTARKYSEHPIAVSRRGSKTAESPSELVVYPKTLPAVLGEERPPSGGVAEKPTREMEPAE